ncbi:hypothetical protein [Flagellimonas crocea]|uniref:hypothetical protein n=1 Tax=Flagellimonas crocea TaxID=3067311 RepID=UPI00296F7212|nr:hypothetical protein [Muricauda sp. DH64]
MKKYNSTAVTKQMEGEDFQKIFESQSKFIKRLILFFSIQYIIILIILNIS